MLLSREHVIASIRGLQPTYSSLNALVEYIALFPSDFGKIIDIVLKESLASNPYTNLFILYLLNELLNKHMKQDNLTTENIGTIETIKTAIKEVLQRGKQKIEEIETNSTDAFKKSAKELASKYGEIEKLICKEETTGTDTVTIAEDKTKNSKDTAETYLDIEYLENLCKKKDKKKILKYIKELKKLV